MATKASIDWSTEDEEKLIDFFQERPQLWDPKNDNYSKANKSTIFDELPQVFNGKYVLYKATIYSHFEKSKFAIMNTVFIQTINYVCKHGFNSK